MKRILITTALGLVAGVICMLGGMSIGIAMTPVTVGWILLNRMVLGFLIGISGLRMHWAWHGLLIGLVVGSLFSYSAFRAGGTAVLVSGTLFAGAVFGVAIEFLTTVVFKQPRLIAGEAARSKAAAA